MLELNKNIIKYDNSLGLDLVPRATNYTQSVVTRYFDLLNGNACFSITEDIDFLRFALIDNKNLILKYKDFPGKLCDTDEFGNKIETRLTHITNTTLITTDSYDKDNYPLLNAEKNTITASLKFLVIMALDSTRKIKNINNQDYTNCYLIMPLDRIGTTEMFKILEPKIGILDRTNILQNFDYIQTNFIGSNNLALNRNYQYERNVLLRTNDKVGFLSNEMIYNSSIFNDTKSLSRTLNMVANNTKTKKMDLYVEPNFKFGLYNITQRTIPPYTADYTFSYIKYEAFVNEFCKNYEIVIYNAESYKNSKKGDNNVLIPRYYKKEAIENYHLNIDLDLKTILKTVNYGLDINNNYENIIVVLKIDDGDRQYLLYDVELAHNSISTYSGSHHWYTRVGSVNLDYNMVLYDNKEIDCEEIDFKLTYEADDRLSKTYTYFNGFANVLTDTITRYEVQILNYQDNTLIKKYKGFLYRDSPLSGGNARIKIKLEDVLLNYEKDIFIRFKILNDCEERFISIKKKCSKTFDTKSYIINDRYKYREVSSILYENKNLNKIMDSYYSNSIITEKSSIALLNQNPEIGITNIISDSNNNIKILNENTDNLFMAERLTFLDNADALNLTGLKMIKNIEDENTFHIIPRMVMYKSALIDETPYKIFANKTDADTESHNYFTAYLYFPQTISTIFDKYRNKPPRILTTSEINQLVLDDLPFGANDFDTDFSRKIYLNFYADNASLVAGVNFIRLGFDTESVWIRALQDNVYNEWNPKLIIVTDKIYQEFNLRNNNNTLNFSSKLGNIFELDYDIINTQNPISHVDISMTEQTENNTLMPNFDKIEMNDLYKTVPTFDNFLGITDVPSNTVGLNSLVNDNLGILKDNTSTVYETKFKLYKISDSFVIINAKIKYLIQNKKTDPNLTVSSKEFLNNIKLFNKTVFELYRNEGTINEPNLILLKRGEVPTSEKLAFGSIDIDFSGTINVSKQYILKYRVMDNGIVENNVYTFFYTPVI